MKCTSMRIVNILFFIANVTTIYSAVVSIQDKTSSTTTSQNAEVAKDNFEKKCPQILNVIRDNNLTDYTINCKKSVSNNFSPKDDACFLVKKMFSFVCSKKLNMTSEYLLSRNFSHICPFNFSHLEQLEVEFKNLQSVAQLLNKDNCSKVCYTLYSTDTQCILLSKFNNFLKDYQQMRPITQSEVERPLIDSKITNINTQKTVDDDGEIHNNDQDSEKNVAKENIAQEKSYSDLNKDNEAVESLKEKKVEKPITSSTPNENFKFIEKTEKNEVKVSELGNDEPKLSNDDSILDNEGSNDYVLPGGDALSNKPEQNLPPELSFEDKSGSSVKEKDIYAGGGFSQAEDSHFFFYFIMVSSVVIIGYLAFHNKNKILAYALEGTSTRRSRRRPNPARYRKLETNLEEAISSNPTNRASANVVY